jgi:hypothetical protein
MDAQIYRLLVLGCALSGILFLVAAVCFSIAQIAPWGIRLIVFEIAGIALVCFSFGLGRKLTLLLIFYAAAVIPAAFFDPYIWRRQGLRIKAVRKTSLFLNGAIGAIGGFAYLFGLLLSKTRP